MKWAEEQRQLFIKERVEEYGSINRQDLMSEFRIKEAQATRDLRKFKENNPDVLFYNPSERQYEECPPHKFGGACTIESVYGEDGAKAIRDFRNETKINPQQDS